MAIFLFRCPNTGYRVQGWVADDASEDTDETYETVSCLPAGTPRQPEHRKGHGWWQGVVALDVRHGTGCASVL